jgi:hypothetical protein
MSFSLKVPAVTPYQLLSQCTELSRFPASSREATNNGRAEIQEGPLIPTHTVRECYPKNGPNAQ